MIQILCSTQGRHPGEIIKIGQTYYRIKHIFGPDKMEVEETIFEKKPNIDPVDVNPHDWRCMYFDELHNELMIDHNYRFKAEEYEDGLDCWIECTLCGHTKPAEYSDYPDYENDYR